MNFDKWFYDQEKMIQFIFLLIPIVGWVVEILVRISALIKNKATTNIVGLIAFFLVGWAWLPVVVDSIYLLITDKLMFVEINEE